MQAFPSTHGISTGKLRGLPYPTGQVWVGLGIGGSGRLVWELQDLEGTAPLPYEVHTGPRLLVVAGSQLVTPRQGAD